jgi:hypothetical protein
VPITRARPGRGRRLLLGLGGVAALAAGLAAYVASRDHAGREHDGARVATATAGWSGTVTRPPRRRRSAPGATCAAGRRGARRRRLAAAGRGRAAAGSRIKTDERTRVWLALDDGSQLVLDHATEVVLTPGAARQVELIAGRVAADITARGDVARVTTARARLDVLGTRFIVTARLTCGPGDRLGRAHRRPRWWSVDVRAGEEGVAGDGA